MLWVPLGTWYKYHYQDIGNAVLTAKAYLITAPETRKRIDWLEAGNLNKLHKVQQPQARGSGRLDMKKNKLGGTDKMSELTVWQAGFILVGA